MLFPTHRVLDFPEGMDENTLMQAFNGSYSVTKFADQAEGAAFLSGHEDPGTMLMVLQSGIYGLLLNQEFLESLHPVYREIDTYLLQKNIITSILKIPDEQLLAKKGIYFYQEDAEAIEHVRDSGGVGFILKPVKMESMRKLAESGLVMPQKSTFFYPKLATGLLINELK
jgi:uncharacterized protein (DUF1015 family)